VKFKGQLSLVVIGKVSENDVFAFLKGSWAMMEKNSELIKHQSQGR
jgi:hypothetical protein